MTYSCKHYHHYETGLYAFLESNARTSADVNRLACFHKLSEAGQSVYILKLMDVKCEVNWNFYRGTFYVFSAEG